MSSSSQGSKSFVSTGIDRTKLLPRHADFHIFPNSPLFSVLLRHAYRDRTAIRDVRAGVEKKYRELLADVLNMRRVTEAALDPQTLLRLVKREEVFIGILAPGGYDFTVAVLTILAMGAAAVPMAVSLPVKEAHYFVRKSNQIAILMVKEALPLGKSVADIIKNSDGRDVQTIEISYHKSYIPIKPSGMLISSDRYLCVNSAGLVVFTSGSTGPPKAVVLRRGNVSNASTSISGQNTISPSDVVLHVLPVHHATGLGINFFPFLLAGACIEFRSGNFDSNWIWERWRAGGLTYFSAVPTIYMRLMWFYEQNIVNLPEDLKQQYVKGANQFHAMLCGSSALPTSMQNFWTKLRNGKVILTRYGATEFGAVFKVDGDDKNTPQNSIGRPVAGVDVKLSNNNEGEILVKTSSMFLKYLQDDEATAAAHDKDGYFRTGDIGHRKGNYYFIDGRASVDIIKSGGYKISGLDVERECLDLPYIAEAMVVGVEDDEFGQRVGAVVTLRDYHSTSSTKQHGGRLLLDELRKDLAGKLIGYKLPTLLRILNEELPKGLSGKVLKRELGPKFFPPGEWRNSPDIQVWVNSAVRFESKL